MKLIIYITLTCLVLSSCAPVSNNINTAQPAVATTTVTTSTPSPAPSGNVVPNFDHIILMMFENQDYQAVIGSGTMPHLEALAQQDVLLSNYFAVRHPSLPNYIALMSGSTQNITSDCSNCFVNQPNLADRIEASGRTWKAYEENMPAPCFVGNAPPYYQKHDPLIYFDSIRLNAARCQKSIVPLTQLDSDLAANQLPNFSFIMPNICNSGHSCPPATADNWVYQMVSKLQASPALGKNSLIIITFDEGSEQSTASCCGLGSKAGGQVATILISPLAKPAFVDSTAYSHYSLLKTILTAWSLPDLGQTQQAGTQPIEAPWIAESGSPVPNVSNPPTASSTTASSLSEN
ncbi:MAG TPA: alkaline phosphatase family protein [Anaerolineales bacterium]